MAADLSEAFERSQIHCLNGYYLLPSACMSFFGQTPNLTLWRHLAVCPQRMTITP
jgi:hypothetical protein